MRESIFTDDDKERFRNATPETNDTPDVMIFIRHGTHSLLIAVEAKMFDVVTERKLRYQIQRQKEYIIDNLGKILSPTESIQIALVPNAMLKTWKDNLGNTKVITWEQIIDIYKPICKESYFVSVIKEALSLFPDLKATSLGFGRNAEDYMKGRDIFDDFKGGALRYRTMGRAQGLNGQRLRDDLNNRRWPDTVYEVSDREAPPPHNRNWFLIKDFVDEIEKHD